MINPNGLQSFFISCQFLIMQGVIPKQVFDFVDRVEYIHDTDVSADDLWLKPMFLITCLALIEEFPKIFFFKNNFHYRINSAAKIVKRIEVRKFCELFQ